MAEDWWFVDYERAVDDFTRDGDEVALRRRFRDLGMDGAEIDQEIERISA